jgi:hypothetical protein
MTARHSILILVLAVTTSLMLAGCGGGDSDTETKVLPKDTFAHRADLICSDVGNEQAELASSYLQKHPNAKDVELVESAGIPPLEKGIRELKELGLPRGHEAQTEAFFAELEKAVKVLTEEPEAALSEQDHPFKTANKLGAQLGLGDCSRNP